MDDAGWFSVRRIRHGSGVVSHWIFTPDAEVHRPSLKVLTRFGSSSQQTYAYSLVDHLNWLHANGKTPNAITFGDLQRYMNGVTGQTDGIYGAAWRRPEQEPIGPSAAGNVATIVKAYYLSLSGSDAADPELINELTSHAGVARMGKSTRMVESNPLAPKKSSRRPRLLPDEVVEVLFQPGVLPTARDVMIVTWLHDGGLFSRGQSPCASVVL